MNIARLFLFYIFIIFMPSLWAINGQETFLQANKEYQAHNYEKALTLYSKIEQKGAAVLYNMGNCYYELGHEADALICWGRAQKGGQLNIMQDSMYNIDFVLNGPNKLEKENSFISVISSLNAITQYGSTLILQILFMFLWIGFCVALFLSKRSKKYKVASFILCLLLIPVGVVLGVRYMQNKNDFAIVHTDTNLYAGPNEKYHVIGSLGAKDQLAVYTKKENWYKVAHSKQVGWVNADAVLML